MGGVSNAYNTQANQLGALQPLVEPGYGRLTEAGIRAIQDARRATMGDLRQNLARRRVSGSSFAQNDINRTNAEFTKQQNEFASQAFTQELAAKQQLINDQATASANAYLQSIQQTNIDSQLATQLASGVTTVLSNNAQLIGDMSNRGSNTLLTGLGTGLGYFLGA